MNAQHDRWTAPGAGEWVRLADHFDRPWTAEYERIFCPSFRDGAATYLHDYGLPVRTIDVRTVHGYPYLHPVPIVGPDSSRVPPAALLRIVARVAPALRRCERNARRTLRDRPWRTRAKQWWNDDRPIAIAGNRKLAAVDPASLDDHALALHLEDCEHLAFRGYEQHFALHGTDLFPIGLYLDACRRRSIDVAAALDLVVERRQVPGGLELDPANLAHTIVDGYDIDRPRMSELPAEVRDAITSLRRRSASPTPVEEVVPDEHRADLAPLLEDACAVLPVRDDNGVILGAWRMGMLRRAYLEAGARLAAAGVLDDAALALEADVPELCTLLDDSANRSPLADTLRTRAAERARWAPVDAPLRLGPAVDVPVESLPRALRTVAGAQLVLRDLITRVPRAGLLQGLGIGTTAAEGTARVAMTADDAISNLEPGDVLVVRATSPAFNAVLPLAAALVTEHGGLLSHAAIAARELGIPAVVGVRDAAATISDGARVRVDPASGRVEVLDGRSPTAPYDAGHMS